MEDTISKLRDLLLSQSKAGRLRALLDSVYGAAQTGAEAYGSASQPLNQQQAGMLGGLLADFTPVVGDVKSAYDGMNAAREGDYLGAALGGLGALPLVPNLAAGLKVFHGSPHGVDWLINGEKFDSARPPLNMASKYTWANPKQSVAETYAGTSEMQRWKAAHGMGAEPMESAGVAMLDLANGRPYKMKDPKKTALEFGVDLKDPSFLEKMLDKAKELGYTHFINSADGGNVAILDDAIIKSRKAIK